MCEGKASDHSESPSAAMNFVENLDTGYGLDDTAKWMFRKNGLQSCELLGFKGAGTLLPSTFYRS